MSTAETVPDATARPPTRRERFRQATIEEIKYTAREQMASEGPAGLSLRAVARAMNITPSALYRYFEGIDDLITALCVDAYNALADAVTEAVAAAPAEDHIARWRAFAHAVRDWALANPADYALIYGTPLPGYQAPEGVTRPAARRYFEVPLRVIAGAVIAGTIDLDRAHLQYEPKVNPGLLSSWNEAGVPMDARLIAVMIGAAVLLQGHITYELFGHFNWLENAPDLVWNGNLNAMMITMGFDPQLL